MIPVRIHSHIVGFLAAQEWMKMCDFAISTVYIGIVVYKIFCIQTTWMGLHYITYISSV